MPPLALRVARRYPVLSVALALGIMAYIQLRSPTSSPGAAVPSYATTGGAETFQRRWLALWGFGAEACRGDLVAPSRTCSPPTWDGHCSMNVKSYQVGMVLWCVP